MSDVNMDSLFGGKSKFDDPFMMPSSAHMPDDLNTALDFCMFLYYLNPQYRRASARPFPLLNLLLDIRNLL